MSCYNIYNVYAMAYRLFAAGRCLDDFIFYCLVFYVCLKMYARIFTPIPPPPPPSQTDPRPYTHMCAR